MPYIIPNTTAIPQTVSAAQVIVNGTTCTWPPDKIVEGVKVLHHIECSIGTENTGAAPAELKFTFQYDIGSGWEGVTGEVACYTIAAGDSARRKANFKVPYYTGISGFVPRYRLLAECPVGEITLHRAEGRDAVPTVTIKQEHEFEGTEPIELISSSIAAMNSSSYVLIGDTLKDTGHNSNGHLGLGDNTNRNVFTAVAGTGWSRLFGASNGNAVTAFAIKTDGSLWGAGENSRGQLGIVGDTADKNVFLELTWPTDTIIDIAISSHVVVLLANGDVYTAGWNDVGQLGLGDTANRDGLGFEKVAGKYRAVAVGQKFTILLGQDGSLYGFGQNTSGQLGTGDFVNVYSPTLLPINDVVKFSCRNLRTAVIKRDGTLWFAGQNPVTFQNVNVWTQQESGTDWVETFSPQHFLRSDGSLWVIGTNTSGELGLGHTTSPVSVMTQVGTDTDWEHVSVGLAHSIAKKGGNLMRWGFNNLGQLGTGGTGTVLSPQVFTA